MTSDLAQHPHTIRRIPVDRIRLSPPAQREFREAMTNRIIASFNRTALGVIVANERDGYFYVVDGQHRTEAARRQNITELDALVYTGLTIEEEAKAFLDLNNRLNVDAIDYYRVSLTARDTKSLLVQTELDTYGITIGTGRNQVKAVGAIVRAYDRDVLPELLGITEGVPEIATRDYRADSLNGLSLLLQRYRDIVGRDRMVRAITTAGGPTAVKHAAARAAETYGARGEVSYGIAWHTIYNTPARGRARLDSWFAQELRASA